MVSAYLAWMMRRLSLRVGVSSSLSAVHSVGSRRQALTCWTRARRWLAAATAAATSAREAVGPGPGGGHLGVEGEQGDQVGAAVAVGQGLADQSVRDQQVFHQGGWDVLTAGRDDQFLLAVDHGQEAVLVDGADVAGV